MASVILFQEVKEKIAGYASGRRLWCCNVQANSMNHLQYNNIHGLHNVEGDKSTWHDMHCDMTLSLWNDMT